MVMTDLNFKKFRIYFVVVIVLCFLTPIMEFLRVPGAWVILGAWFGFGAYKGILKANAIDRVQHQYELGQMNPDHKPTYRLKDLELLGFDYESIRTGIEDEALETLADLENRYHDIIEEKNLEGDEFMFITDKGDKGYKQ